MEGYQSWPESAKKVSREWLEGLVPSSVTARKLVVLTLVQALGASLFLACSAIFLHKVAGLRTTEIGYGLSIAGLIGFAATVPITRLAARAGARTLLIADYLLLSAAFAGYGFVDSLPSFVFLACGVAIGEAAGSPLRAAVAYAAVTREEAVGTRAQMRSSFNIGSACGVGLAAIALLGDNRAAFIVVGGANALAHLVCAALAWSIKEHRAPASNQGAGRGMAGRLAGTALRDRRFVAVTLINGALELHGPLLTVALPLWIITRTAVPAVANSVLLICNTATVVIFQVRLSRDAGNLRGAARLQNRGGLLLASACLVLLVSNRIGPALGFVVLVIGVLLLSFGEILQSAGAWTASFEMPPPGRQSEYQGVFALGRGLRQSAGPWLVTSVILGLGAWGWLIFAAGFVVLGRAAMAMICAGGDGHVTSVMEGARSSA